MITEGTPSSRPSLPEDKSTVLCPQGWIRGSWARAKDQEGVGLVTSMSHRLY